MYEDADNRLRTAVNRNGFVFASLPPSSIRRWVPQRKAEVVKAVHMGLLSMDEACTRYELSREEFESWNRAYATDGLPGLRASVRHRTDQNPHH